MLQKAFNWEKRSAVAALASSIAPYKSSVERDVAVKIILPRYANHPNFIRRYEAEAQLIARLEHPYIVPLYDYWRDPDAANLIMRLLRGGSLEDQLRSGPIPIDLVRGYTQQIGMARDVAHRHGEIHRDVKYHHQRWWLEILHLEGAMLLS